MIESLAVRVLLAWLVGLGLGKFNFWLFEKSMNGLVDGGQMSRVKLLAVKSGVFRHVFVFLAGIGLIQAARLPPIHLCGGLLLATLWSRLGIHKRAELARGEENK